MFTKIVWGLSFPILLFSEGLNGLIEMALKNKNVIASEQTIESVKDEYKSAKEGYLPSVNVGAGYSDASHETAQYANNALNTYVDVSYTVYDGGKKDLTYQSYESQIKASQQGLESLKNQVALEVVEYYYNYLTYVAQKEAKRQEIEQLNAQRQRLRKFFDAGTITIDELDRIVSTVESANLELHELDLNIETVLHELEYITGRKVVINQGSTIEVTYDDNELRNDVKSLEHSMRTQLLNAKSIQTADNPQVSLSNTYSYYDNNYKNKAYSIFSPEKQNVFAVQVKWNVFDFDSTKTAHDAAHKDFLSKEAKFEYEKNKAGVDLSLALKSYEIAKLKIKSAKSGLRASISTYRVVKNKYENGLVDNISYLEALSDKSEAQSALSTANYNLEVRKANVMYQKGKNVWEYVR